MPSALTMEAFQMLYSRTSTLIHAIALLVLTSSASFAVVYVNSNSPGPTFDGNSWTTAYHTVQEGLTAALPTDEVWVATGKYVGQITLKEGVGLYGGFTGVETSRDDRDWRTNETILDGGGLGVVTAPDGLTSTAVIDGFTIQNGDSNHAYHPWAGGGIYCNNSSPTIRHNRIVKNRSGYKAGGIFVTGGSPRIEGNYIGDNWSREPGSAIYCVDSSPLITGNVIIANETDQGGTISSENSSPVIANNIIAHNTAPSSSAIGSRGGATVLANNTIVRNLSIDQGSAVQGAFASIKNNIIAFNNSGLDTSFNVNPDLDYNCVFGNGQYDYRGAVPGPHSLSTDPKFAGLNYGNLHIQSDSPCRDAGDDSVVQPGWLDSDGQPRVEGSHVDIGADESVGTVWASGPYVIVRVSPDGNDNNDGSSWTLAKRTVQAAVDAASAVGGEVWVGKGVYNEHIDIGMYAYVYGGFAGTETSREQRDWETNATILDPQSTDRVVTMTAGHEVTAVDGFTIRNGAGIYSINCSPTISNNRVVYNSVDSCGAITCTNGSATISNNIVNYNMSINRGGGIECGGGDYCKATVVGNTVLANVGWGIAASAGTTTITHNKVFENSGTGIGAGGHAVIANNIVVNNHATEVGGGISYGGFGPAFVYNNTIMGNTGAVNTGGLYIFSAEVIAANNIVAFNSAGICRRYISQSLTLLNNDVYSNSGQDYYNAARGTTNMSVDPMIACPAYGNFHIQANSPCRDAGDDSVIETGWVDIDGQARIQGRHVDIGADESDGVTWSTDPNVIVRVSVHGSDDNDGSSWTSAKRTLQAAIDAAAAVGGEVWVKMGTYNEHVALPCYVYLYGGFGGDETQRDQRNWSANTTILDGQQGGEIVTVRGGQPVAIDGFTIRNANPYSGGAIHCLYSSPTIRNNTLTANGAQNSGAAIYCEYSSPLIADNRITNNTTRAIYLSYSSPTITGNTITSNAVAGYGAGIYFYYSSAVITGNTIANNVTQYSGGAIYQPGDGTVISNNRITGNRASDGSAVYGSADMTITNNIIAGNRTESYKSAAVSCHSASSSYILANNTIVDNTSTQMGSAINCSYGTPSISNNIISYNSGGIFGGSTAPILRNNCVYGNSYNYDGVVKGASDIQSDPLLVNRTGGDYHIMTTSPCKNAGYDGAVQPGAVDMDGDIRLQDTHVDIGADEIAVTAAPTFTPGGGQYTTVLNVSISSATPGAVIRYTTDGTDPTLEDPVVTGLVRVGWSLTLKAKAWKVGYPESPVTSADYLIKVVTSEAKKLPNGDGAESWGIVTAVFGSLFYIEAEDRSSGIAVLKTSHGVLPGMRIVVRGTTSTNIFGEKYIQGTTIEQQGSGSIEPLLMPNRTISGADWQYDPVSGTGQKGVTEYRYTTINGTLVLMPLAAADPNNIGLLVTTTGKVTAKGSNWFYLDDGSALRDNTTYIGVKVQTTTGMTVPAVGTQVKVTGISSCSKSGADLYRLLRGTSITSILP